MVKETKTAGQPDVYMCDPTSISIKKGDSVSFTNETDEIQNFDQGDESQAGIALKLTLNQSSTVTFNTTGTFNLKSEKGATLSVTVQ
jgi:plastocyanin